MTARRNISRLDYGRTAAWWVRFTRLDSAGAKRVVSKMFSDGVHGGKRKALVAATQWRDRMARKLRPPARGGGHEPVPPGYGYVKRIEVKRRVDWHPVYVAWVRVDGGRNRQTTCSVRLWGEMGAKRRCQRWLVKQRRELRARMSRKKVRKK
jgi:hypothetical protein